MNKFALIPSNSGTLSAGIVAQHQQICVLTSELASLGKNAMTVLGRRLNSREWVYNCLCTHDIWWDSDICQFYNYNSATKNYELVVEDKILKLLEHINDAWLHTSLHDVVLPMYNLNDFMKMSDKAKKALIRSSAPSRQIFQELLSQFIKSCLKPNPPISSKDAKWECTPRISHERIRDIFYYDRNLIPAHYNCVSDKMFFDLFDIVLRNFPRLKIKKSKGCYADIFLALKVRKWYLEDFPERNGQFDVFYDSFFLPLPCPKKPKLITGKSPEPDVSSAEDENSDSL